MYGAAIVRHDEHFSVGESAQRRLDPWQSPQCLETTESHALRHFIVVALAVFSQTHASAGVEQQRYFRDTPQPLHLLGKNPAVPDGCPMQHTRIQASAAHAGAVSYHGHGLQHVGKPAVKVVHHNIHVAPLLRTQRIYTTAIGDIHRLTISQSVQLSPVEQRVQSLRRMREHGIHERQVFI